MARKRLVSPELFIHGELYDAEEASGLPLRLAFIGLWTQADRRGLFVWKPRELKLAILPHDTVDMASTMLALCQHGFVEYYEVEGRGYGRIPSFHRWQTFHVKERPDLRIPEPLTGSPTTRTPPSTVPAPCSPSASTPGTDTITGTITGTNYMSVADAPAPKPAVKASKKSKPDEAKYPYFPNEDRKAAYDIWTNKRGPVDMSRLVRAFAPAWEHAGAEGRPTRYRLLWALRTYLAVVPHGRSAPFVSVEQAANLLVPLARLQDAHSDALSINDAAAQLVHGHALKVSA